MDPLNAGCHGGRSTVSGLAHVYIEIVVGQHRATHGGNPYGPAPYVPFVYYLGNQALRYPMAATRAIMGCNPVKRFWWCVQGLHNINTISPL